MKRRTFLGAATLLGIVSGASAGSSREPGNRPPREGMEGRTPDGGTPGDHVPGDGAPVIVSTWNFEGANDAAWKTLDGGGSPLDAVEAGIRVPEADPRVTSVGLGGHPDRDGILTLDASIMEGTGACGSVVFTRAIDHPISAARLVMEKTPHVLLAGEGADRFAAEHGLGVRRELTPGAREAWETWKRSSGYRPPPIGPGNHDTIGMLALKGGRFAGGCSTSGAAWKMHGRVGDSPIIGAGLFVDDAAGAATATGLGEEVIRIAGCAVVVESLRRGASPEEACRTAAERLRDRRRSRGGGFVAAFLALSRAGEAGAFGLGAGFEYALTREGVTTVVRAPFLDSE